VLAPSDFERSEGASICLDALLRPCGIDRAVSDENPEKPAEKAPKAKKVKDGETAKDRNQRIREEAAERRRSKREDDRRRAAPARNLDAGEMVDDALARGTHNIGLWLKKNFGIIQWVVVLGVAGGIGYKVYSVRHERSIGETSDKLVAALEAEAGTVGEQNTEPDRYTGLIDDRPHFATEEERLKAAAAAYKAAASSTLGGFAKLGEAGILFDQAKYKEALAAYEAARDSDLAKRDNDVRGRAIEGVGLSQEALGNTDAALKSFRELENSGISGFGLLGIYHQARVSYAKGDVEKAKELITTAQKKLADKAKDKPRVPGMPPGYLEASVRDLLSIIDPSAAATMAGPSSIDPALLQKLRGESANGKMTPERLQEILKGLTGPGAPGGEGAPPEGMPEAPIGEAPPAEAPAPAAPPEPEKPPEKAPEPKKAPAPAKKPAPAPQGQAPAAPAPEAPPAAPAPAPAAPAPVEGSGAP
jgi:predicted negative regulator of RcsB-dependent stress response